MLMQVPAAADTVNVDLGTIRDLVDFVEVLPDQGVYISAAIGLLLFIIGWFGGTKYSFKKVVWCTMLVTLVAVFSLPIAARAYVWLQPSLGATAAFAILYIIWIAIFLAMSISLYETLIVTAEEGRPN